MGRVRNILNHSVDYKKHVEIRKKETDSPCLMYQIPIDHVVEVSSSRANGQIE